MEGVEKPRNEEGNTQECEMRLVKGPLHLLHVREMVQAAAIEMTHLEGASSDMTVVGSDCCDSIRTSLTILQFLLRTNILKPTWNVSPLIGVINQ